MQRHAAVVCLTTLLFVSLGQCASLPPNFIPGAELSNYMIRSKLEKIFRQIQQTINSQHSNVPPTPQDKKNESDGGADLAAFAHFGNGPYQPKLFDERQMWSQGWAPGGKRSIENNEMSKKQMWSQGWAPGGK